MSSAYRLVPWTGVADPHDDVKGGALDMGRYAVDLAQVHRRSDSAPAVYGNADRFFAATYFTERMRQILTDVMTVLAGGQGDRILQLRTPFGGGKTHSLVALLHLARDREAAAGVPELTGMPDPGPVRLAVLSGDELEALRPQALTEGIETRTLWGELGAQLNRYDLVAEHDRERVAPGGETLRRLLGDQPVLLLLDELLIYIEKAMAVSLRDSTLGRQTLLFVQTLTNVVNALPRAAMVYSLQKSVGEAVGSEGLLNQLDHLVSRVDAKREPVTGDEVMRVVQRRLFADVGTPEVHRAVAAAYADLLGRQLVAQAETDAARHEARAEAQRLEERVLASYPFHPALLDLMYHRWGSLPSYQRTRGALQFLASVTHDLWERRDDSPLIGPGDVDFADAPTRSAFFSQVGEGDQYASVLDGDVISAGSGAATVDRRVGADSPALARLQVGTRLARAIMLYSFGSRQGEERGVLESDLTAAALVPGLDRNVILAALHDLREEELYLHSTGRRYRFEPTANLSKLVRDEANALSPGEVLDVVRRHLEEELRGERGVALWPEDTSGARDEVPVFTFAYLHPDWRPERGPALAEFVERCGASRRRYRNGLGLVLPDAAQFDRARASARILLAARSLLGRSARHGFTTAQQEELREKEASALRELRAAVGHCYSRVIVPVSPGEGDGPFRLEEADLRSLLAAGRRLQERVREALSHRVFDSLIATRLVSLAGLTAERPYVRCAELVDWFFTYFEFTKLTDRRPIQAAVADAVHEGQVAYAAAVEVVDDEIRLPDPSLVRLGVHVAADELDMGGDAALLVPELARRLLAPSGGKPDEPGPLDVPPLPERPSPRPPAGPDERAQRVTLSATVRGEGLFDLEQALVWLRDQSSSFEVHVIAKATAAASGYDEVRFRNGVIERLDEARAEDVNVRLE